MLAVIRVNKTGDYTVMSNAHLKEKEMSLKAKGLLSVMLSLPDTWDYSIAGLCAICAENVTAIKSTLGELKKFGYLIVTKKMPNETESGRIEYEYNIFEKPQKQAVEKQDIENLPLENQGVENPAQLNTKQANTKKSNTKQANNKDKSGVPASIQKLIEDYAKGHADIIELLYEWVKVRKAKRAAMTDKAIELNLNKLDKLAKESGLSVKIYLQEVICRGWQAFYPISNYASGNGKTYGANGIAVNKTSGDLDGVFK